MGRIGMVWAFMVERNKTMGIIFLKRGVSSVSSFAVTRISAAWCKILGRDKLRFVK